MNHRHRRDRVKRRRERERCNRDLLTVSCYKASDGDGSSAFDSLISDCDPSSFNSRNERRLFDEYGWGKAQRERERDPRASDAKHPLVCTGSAAKEEVKETERLVRLCDAQGRRAVCQLHVHGCECVVWWGFVCDAADGYPGHDRTADNPSVVDQVLVDADWLVYQGDKDDIIVLVKSQLSGFQYLGGPE